MIKSAGVQGLILGTYLRIAVKCLIGRFKGARENM